MMHGNMLAVELLAEIVLGVIVFRVVIGIIAEVGYRWAVRQPKLRFDQAHLRIQQRAPWQSVEGWRLFQPHSKQ